MKKALETAKKVEERGQKMEIKGKNLAAEIKADEKQALETAKKVKESTVKIKIPVDPMNPKDLIVPIMINGYKWKIKRGETVEVPEAVADILEEAKYI